MEGASFGIPALAASLETAKEHHLSYSNDIDFDSAVYFTAFFAEKLLKKTFPPEVQILKVDVPREATPETSWQMCRLSPNPYYLPIVDKNQSLTEPCTLDYQVSINWDIEPNNTDVYTLHKRRKVAVTALTLDFTAPIALENFDNFLRE